MINLINVEEPLRNALETIGWYCKHNDCKTCSLKINDDTCITDKDPDIWWMYLNTDRKTEPQLTAKCLNCVNSGSYKCSRCDGEMYFKDEPQTNKNFEVTYTCSFTDCDNFKNFGFGEKCIECKRKQSEAKYKDELQNGYCNECKWYGNKQVCGRCRSRNLYAPKDELRMKRSK